MMYFHSGVLMHNCCGVDSWIGYYNARRPHSILAGRTPDEAYWADGATKLAA
jgi:putative transposase